MAEDTSTKSDTGEIKSVGHITSLFGCYFKSPNDVLPAPQRNVSMAAVPGAVLPSIGRSLCAQRAVLWSRCFQK